MRETTVDNHHTHNMLSFNLESGFNLPTAGASCALSEIETQWRTAGSNHILRDCVILHTHNDGTLRLQVACTHHSHK